MKRLILSSVLCLVSALDAGEKIISAAEVSTVPVIDGDLSDEVWKSAECRSDFREVSGAVPLGDQKTELRILHDGNRLYFGVRMEFEKLPEGPNLPWNGKLAEEDYSTHQYSVEFYLDPGRSMSNYYQYLVNFRNEARGNFNLNWKAQDPGVKIAGKRNGKVWTLEFSFPGEGKLKPGTVWGFDLVRNNELFYSMWHPINGPFCNPLAFGTLLIGSYRQWFTASIGEMRMKLEKLRKSFTGDSALLSVVDGCGEDLKELEKNLASGKDPTRLFQEAGDIRNTIRRLEDSALCFELENADSGPVDK